MAKIKKNHDQNNENHCQAKCFQHMSPVNVLITAVVFRFAIPSEIFWTLVLIYVIYILYVPKSTPNRENDAENENDDDKVRKRKTSFEEIKSVRRILQIYRFVSSKPAIFGSNSNRSVISRNNSSTMLMDSPSLPVTSNNNDNSLVDSARNSFSSGSATGSTLTTSTEISSDVDHDSLISSDKFRSPKPRWYSSLICRNHQRQSLNQLRRRHYSADINSNYIVNGSGSTEVDNQDERHQQTAVDKPKTSKFAYQNVVNVVLIKGSHLCADNQDYYVKFRLGKEKHKSKIVSSAVQHPFWGESFDLYLYPDQPKLLEIHFCSLNREFSEKTAIDLDSLPQDQTHRLQEKLTSDPSDRGSVELLVTVTGGGGSSSDESECSSIDSGYYEDISRQYETFNNWPNFSDTGHLIVKVHEAENLADSNKINAFCVLQLVNDKTRTQTEYKTNSPKWDKIFNFKFSDINSILEILIFNEESKNQNKFLGKVVVPLSQIQNNEKRWFELRDKKLQHFMGGGRILLEFGMAFNTLKAGIRIIFTPQEQNILLEPKIKFRNAQLMRSAARLKSIYKVIQRWGHFIASCIDWECPIRSVVGFIYSYAFLYYFQWWMIPAWLLAIMVKNYIRLTFGPYWKEQQQNYSKNHNNFDSNPQEDLEQQIEQFKDDDTKQLVRAESSSSSQSLREKLQSYQEILFFFIKILLENMSILEKFENIGNFTVPFLSWVGVAVLVLILTVGLRFFLLFLLVNEFTKAFRGLNERRNCEPLNILLRAPDFDEMLMYHVNQ